MEPLKTSFKKDGFTFEQIRREGDLAIFTKTKPHFSKPHYEVIIVQEFKERTFPNGIISPAKEGFPSNEQWGQFGWSYPTLEEVTKKFEALKAQKKP